MLRVLVFKDIRRWWSDRHAVVVTLLLPLLLTAVLGFSFGGFGGSGPASTTIPLAIVGDVAGPVRSFLDDALSRSGLFAPTWCDSAAAAELVRAGDVRAAVLLPPDLLGDLFGGERVAIGVWKDPVSVYQAQIVEEILRRLLLRERAGEALYYGAWPQDWFPQPGAEGPLQELFAGDSAAAIWRRIRDDDPAARKARRWLTTLIDHETTLSDAFSQRSVSLTVVDRRGEAADEDPRRSRNMFDWILPGMGVFFLMFAAGAASADLHRERERGTLRRLLVAPLGRADLLAGKWAFALLNGLLQLGVLFAVGALVFRMNLGPDPFALPLAMLGTAAMLASLYLPLAMLTRDEKQMGQWATGITLFLAIVGGNFINVDQMPAVLQRIGRFTPNYWSNRALSDVVVGDRGVADVFPRTLILLAIAAVLLGVAILLYRRRGGREGLL